MSTTAPSSCLAVEDVVTSFTIVILGTGVTEAAGRIDREVVEACLVSAALGILRISGRRTEGTLVALGVSKLSGPPPRLLCTSKLVLS